MAARISFSDSILIHILIDSIVSWTDQNLSEIWIYTFSQTSVRRVDRWLRGSVVVVVVVHNILMCCCSIASRRFTTFSTHILFAQNNRKWFYELRSTVCECDSGYFFHFDFCLAISGAQQALLCMFGVKISKSHSNEIENQIQFICCHYAIRNNVNCNSPRKRYSQGCGETKRETKPFNCRWISL